jgi:hypothetical protein
MSLVIWYRLTISEAEASGGGGGLAALASAAASAVGLPVIGLPLTVSNDIFGGSMILDADIVVTMTEGASADTFEVTLTNLPGSAITLLPKVAAGPLAADIQLGYFDEPETTTGSRPVMKGRITSLSSWVGEDGLSRVKLTGQELGGYLLRSTDARVALSGAATADDFVTAVVQKAGLSLAPGSKIGVSMENFTLRTPSGLAALQNLADLNSAPIVVRDGSVLVGPAVGAATDRAPVAFDPELNVVARGDGQQEQSTVNAPPPDTDDDTGGSQAPGTRPPLSTQLELTVLGHPGLRVGQVATVRNLDDVPPDPLRIAKVEHRFGVRSGYVCQVTLVAAPVGQRVDAGTGVQAVADRLQLAGQRDRNAHPAIDVGEVSTYAAGADGKHLATLFYGQNPSPGVVAPSVQSPVDNQQLHEKPLSSPFAFGTCGLVTPVYPKMRALLAHNSGLVNDAVVAGFIWPADAARPKNKAGDYWLALPTGLGDDGMPSGKAANDLIDAAGYRVLQASGLHILVGADALPKVGTRPDPPTDDTVTIEHKSGTTIVIGADGGVTITTSHKPIKLANGDVTLTLDGTAVKVQ